MTSNQTREQSIKLKLEGDKLTGTAPGPNNTEINIENATLKEGQISFTVTRGISFTVARDRNGQKNVTKFSGKLEGDTITGKTETERNGETNSRDWVAEREKT